jgi:hypothetical protein
MARACCRLRCAARQGPESPFRERKRIGEAIAPFQHTISAVTRALQCGDAWEIIGGLDDSDED